MRVAVSLLTILVCTPLELFAQKEVHVLDEVIVSTNRVEQSKHDVNGTLHVVDEIELKDYGVYGVEKISEATPNFSIIRTALSTQISMRGVGGGISQGLDQSVGLFIDDITASKAQAFRFPLFDVNRIELAPGAQSTNQGVNTIAGSIQVYSNKPEVGEFGSVSYSYESANEMNEIAGFYNTGTDKLQQRIAFRLSNYSSYIENTQINEDTSDSSAFRYIAGINLSEALNLSIKLETNQFTEHFKYGEITKDESNSVDLGTKYGIAALDGIPSTFSNTLFYVFGQDRFEDIYNNERQTNNPDLSENQLDQAMIKFSFEGDLTWVSKTGFYSLNYDERCDCDFIPTELSQLDLSDEYEQFSQEISFSSKGFSNNETGIHGGLYYHNLNQKFTEQININSSSLLVPIVSNLLASDPTITPETASFLAEQLGETASSRRFKQKTDVTSAYLDGRYVFNDSFFISGSLRRTITDKSASKSLNAIDLNTGDPLANAVPNLYLNIFGIETEQSTGHNNVGSIKENTDDYRFAINYLPKPNINYFMQYKFANKAGGFDPLSNIEDFFEFDGEEVDTYELGVKLKNNDLSLSGVLFYSDFSGLQTSQFDGSSGFTIGNIDRTVSQGFELNASKLFGNLRIDTSLSYNDMEYRDFKNGNCYFGQTPDGEDRNGDGSADSCDYSGKQALFTPRFSGSLKVAKEDLIEDWLLNYGFQSIYNSKTNVHSNYDPDGIQSAYSIENIFFSAMQNDLTLQLNVNNIFDKKVIYYSGNAPLSTIIAQSKTFNSVHNSPRSAVLSISYEF